MVGGVLGNWEYFKRSITENVENIQRTAIFFAKIDKDP